MSGRDNGSPRKLLRMKPLPSIHRSNRVAAEVESKQSVPGQEENAETAHHSLRAIESHLSPNAPDLATDSSEPLHPTADYHAPLKPPHRPDFSAEQRDELSEAPKSQSPLHMPFFYCKISAKHLPQYDVFSSSDPVCFVKEGSSNRIIRAIPRLLSSIEQTSPSTPPPPPTVQTELR